MDVYICPLCIGGIVRVDSLIVNNDNSCDIRYVKCLMCGVVINCFDGIIVDWCWF